MHANWTGLHAINAAGQDSRGWQFSSCSESKTHRNLEYGLFVGNLMKYILYKFLIKSERSMLRTNERINESIHACLPWLFWTINFVLIHGHILPRRFNWQLTQKILIQTEWNFWNLSWLAVFCKCFALAISFCSAAMPAARSLCMDIVVSILGYNFFKLDLDLKLGIVTVPVISANSQKSSLHNAAGLR